MRLVDRIRRALEDGHGKELDKIRDGEVDDIIDDSWRNAAVLIAITDRPEPGVLLTLRNAGLRSHAGQVAFPGGKIDPKDASVEAAALREAEEEIGLLPDQVDIIGTTDVWRTGTGYSITPVLGIVPPDLPLKPHEREVAAIFEAPLTHLLDLANYTHEMVNWKGAERLFTGTIWEGYRIWGATAGMLNNLSLRLESLA